MEVIIAVVLIFISGYVVGRRNLRHRQTCVSPTPSSSAPTAYRQTQRQHTRARHQNTREREYGGFGALGAANDHHDFGDGGF
ncbi:MAG: hypothetical protein RLZZ327_1157 [Actinomycetota bacterium]|jgi:hypothetical protein